MTRYDGNVCLVFFVCLLIELLLVVVQGKRKLVWAFNKVYIFINEFGGCRPKWESVECKSTEQDHLQSLFLAKDLGADYIDLELKVGVGVIIEFNYLCIHKPKLETNES